MNNEITIASFRYCVQSRTLWLVRAEEHLQSDPPSDQYGRLNQFLSLGWAFSLEKLSSEQLSFAVCPQHQEHKPPRPSG